MTTKRIFAVAMLLAVSSGAGAQAMKPGLWEVTSKMQGGGQADASMAQMQQQMASLPPEQRKAMQDMMAKQGVSMGAGGASMKVCMTKDMVERNAMPAQQGSDCKQNASPRSGNTMKFSFTCTKPPSSGEGTVTFSGSESYDMKMTVQATVQGRQEKTNLESSGKWLSADCGAIKPMALPVK